ncbi:hypothetical protein ACHAQE_006056 [Botrytis cinerea]
MTGQAWDVFQDNGKGAENKMDLPEDNPYIFDALASWMYTKHLGGLPSVDEESDIPIIELYIFADKYCIEQLMNFSMDSLQDSLEEWQSSLFCREVESIFDSTSSRLGYPLRSLATAVVAHTILAVLTEFGCQEYDEMFKGVDGATIQVLKRTHLMLRKNDDHRHRVKKSEMDDVEGFEICAFHQHKSGGDCDLAQNLFGHSSN